MKVQRPDQFRGHTVVDGTGRRVGVVRRVVCADRDPYRAEWAVVRIGWRRASSRLVPLTDACHHDRGIQVPYRRDAVVASPAVRRNVDPVLPQAHRFYRDLTP